jgi:hypothetical protein
MKSMKNGHHSEPSPYAHLAELGNEPYSADTLAFAEDVRRVQAIVSTGALDAYSVDERIAIGWAILHRQRDEVH